MNLKLIGMIAGGIVVIAVLLAAAFVPAANINLFFASLALIVSDMKGLIEPIVGLAIAALIAMQAVTMRRQKVATVERAEQSAKIDHVTQQVQAVKSAVVPPQDGVG